MAVSLYTNTRPQEIHNEGRSLLKKKPRELCLGFTAQSQKCFKSRHKVLHFWSMSNNGKEATQELRGELNLLGRMKVTTENSATMASGHFYESICMAHHQEPPSPDLQPLCTNIGVNESKWTIIFQGNQVSLSLNMLTLCLPHISLKPILSKHQ